MPYIGKQPIVGNFQVCDAISVVNGQAAYTMQVGSTNVTPETAFHMLVSLNGVLQKPGSSFTISGSTITFASNLATGDVIDFIILLGDVLNIGAPSDDTVTASSVNNDFISGQTALSATPDDTDEFLVSDAGTIKRVDYSLIKGGGKVLQVVAGTHATEVSSSDSSYVTTNIDASITPSATSSKVLIIVNTSGRTTNGGANGNYTVKRGSTDLDSTGNGFARVRDGDGGIFVNAPIVHLDSPNTTSSTTYTMFMKASGGTVFASVSDSPSEIILMEIGA